jgi:hypothetical protein
MARRRTVPVTAAAMCRYDVRVATEAVTGPAAPEDR